MIENFVFTFQIMQYALLSFTFSSLFLSIRYAAVGVVPNQMDNGYVSGAADGIVPIAPVIPNFLVFARLRITHASSTEGYIMDTRRNNPNIEYSTNGLAQLPRRHYRSFYDFIDVWRNKTE